MKNKIIVFIALGLIALVPMSSCSDYLDKEPDDQLTLESVFENKNNMERWLAYIYSLVPKFYTYDGADAVADELAPSVGWESQGFKAIFYQNGNWTANSGGVISYWTTFPKAIRSAYTFIKYAHAIADVSEKEVNYMKAECRFLIAQFHAMMVMTYGAIPIIREAAEETTGESLLLKQEPFYTVVDWAANEMLEASKELPPFYDDDNKYGRITSLTCLAIRARLLTFAASDLVNGNQDTDMVNMKNCDGTPIFNSEHDPNRWKQAVEANKLVIDQAEKSGHKLHIEYLSNGEDIDPFLSYQNALMLRRNQGNLEIIYPRTYDDAGYFDRQANPRSMGGAGAIGVTQSLVDAFFMRNGLVPITGYTNDGGTPIKNEASGYSEDGYSTVDESFNTRWMYGTAKGDAAKDQNVIVPANTYKMYCGREPRFYISVLYNEEYHWGKKKATNFFNGGEDGGPSHDSPCAGYLIRKRVDPSAIPTESSGNYKNRQGCLYRLAEAYLSYAESLNEYSIDMGTYDSNKKEILKYINKIRERAGIPQYSEGTEAGKITAPTDPKEMRQLIRRERRVEMNCEAGLRFDDLRRWKEAETALDGKFWGMNMLAKKEDRDSYYKRTVYQTRKFISYWWPIPQDEMDVNINLRQLPGWWK